MNQDFVGGKWQERRQKKFAIKKQDTRDHMLYGSIYTRCPGETDLQRQEVGAG